MRNQPAHLSATGKAIGSFGKMRLAVFLLLSLIVSLAQGCGAGEVPLGDGELSPQPTERGSEPPSFVAGSSCTECHQKEFAAWSGSHHDRAMQVANEQTVLGDFDDASFTHFRITSRFFKRGGKFFVNTEGPDGENADFEIKYTFGVEPLQQYLIAFSGGRLQALTIAWDAREKCWFDLQPAEKIKPGDPFHWTGRYQRWNAMCADCHSTDLRKNYDLETDTYKTAWAEINVGCQACHGPGSAHEEWARSKGEGGARGSGGNGLKVKFATDDPQTEIETCAPCQSMCRKMSGRTSVLRILAVPCARCTWTRSGTHRC